MIVIIKCGHISLWFSFYLIDCSPLVLVLDCCNHLQYNTRKYQYIQRGEQKQMQLVLVYPHPEKITIETSCIQNRYVSIFHNVWQHNRRREQTSHHVSPNTDSYAVVRRPTHQWEKQRHKSNIQAPLMWSDQRCFNPGRKCVLMSELIT